MSCGRGRGSTSIRVCFFARESWACPGKSYYLDISHCQRRGNCIYPAHPVPPLPPTTRRYVYAGMHMGGGGEGRRRCVPILGVPMNYWPYGMPLAACSWWVLRPSFAGEPIIDVDVYSPKSDDQDCCTSMCKLHAVENLWGPPRTYSIDGLD